MEQVVYRDLGRISYQEGWELQEELFAEVVRIKLARRDRGEAHKQGKHYLLFCEHDPVFTLGRNGAESNLLINPEHLSSLGIDYHKINRGGDITFHGPGQVVAYPIIDLDCLFTDIGRYLRGLEEIVIRVLAHYDLLGQRIKGATGVWLDADNVFKARKICAIGIRASRWVTMHGFAFNVNTDLDYFKKIIPCGIDDKQVSSLQSELGRTVPLEEVKALLAEAFKAVFEIELIAEQP